jgi:Flp pilus assembly protein TadG
MKPPAISRRSRVLSDRAHSDRAKERGITMILVALAMVAIIAMAALSIDVSTLYVAREEAQRSADAAALAAARVISVSGITTTANPSTDTASWRQICGGVTSSATLTAQAAAQTNAVGGVAAGTITVQYSGGGAGPQADCSSLPQAFAVNPMVTVQVTRSGLPTFFSRIWGRNGNTVGASATAEAFNPSDSGNVGNGPTGQITPVQPRCVKPWAVPNQDPLNPGKNGGNYCNLGTPPGACQPLVNLTTGQIQHPGVSLNGSGTNGVIGETFWLVLDCQHNGRSSCTLRGATTQPQANYNSGATSVKPPPNLLYAPGQVGGTVPLAIPSCSQGDPYEEAIEGCDSSANYQCGVSGKPNVVDLTRNPDTSGATTNGVMCLTNQNSATDTTNANGQDTLNTFGAPSAYPFQILAGSGNPLAGTLSGGPISNSNSVVSLPIYDNTVNISSDRTTNVTFIGFLQVFINAVDQYGNVNVTVLNVAGCGNGTNSTGNPVNGSSPVPVRLITTP